MGVPPAWKVFCKLQPGLGYEIPFKTRALHRSLLRESKKFEKPEVRSFLRNTVSERFRFHQHETSVRRSVNAIEEAERALGILRMALGGNKEYHNRIVAMSLGEMGPLAFVKDKIKKISNPSKRYEASMDIRPQTAKRRNADARISMPDHILQVKAPKPQQPKISKMRPRKPYQQAFKVTDSSGRNFIRVRGWVQPVKTSMMIKNSVRTAQRRRDRYQKYVEDLNMLDGEILFLKGCRVNADDILGAAQPIRMAIADARKLYLQSQNRFVDVLEETTAADSKKAN